MATSAGLTAAVLKDTDTNQFVVHPGAIILANNSICCVDEFNMMDRKDAVCLHEAMEQQTLTINKAGIHTTLQVNTSILAASSPLNGGTYNVDKSLESNSGLLSSLISRFDLFFVVLSNNEEDEDSDKRIAEYILKEKMNESIVHTPYSLTMVLNYLQAARTFEPIICDDVSDFLVKKYSILREKFGTRITVRQLESLIRLSEAFAKLYCLHKVSIDHANMAFLLLYMSFESVALSSHHIISVNNDDEIMVTHEQFKNVQDLIVAFIKTKMHKDNLQCVVRKSVVEWYLKQQLRDVEETERNVVNYVQVCKQWKFKYLCMYVLCCAFVLCVPGLCIVMRITFIYFY